MSDCPEPNINASETLRYSFHPRAGGDVTLISSDGTVFVAHSVFLIFASKTFEKALSERSLPCTINVKEDAETVSLMLAFMYPTVKPPLDTVSLLEKSMVIARRYELEALAAVIIQTGDHQPELVKNNPASIYRLAKLHKFDKLAALAAKAINPSNYDMTTVGGIVKFATIYPESSSLIGIVGIHGARARILHEVLCGNQGTYPLQTELDRRGVRRIGTLLGCDRCTEHLHKPGWLDVWAKQLHSDLAEKSLNQCDCYFELSYLKTLRGYTGSCDACVDRILSDRSRSFGAWSKSVRSLLEEKLAELDVLYTL